MWTNILDALGASRYAQHSICLTSDPIMLFLYSGADFFTFISYLVIGLSLLIRGNRGIYVMLRYRPLFGAFIFLCGLSHLTMLLVLYEGVYRLDVFVRVAMATVSVMTAIFVTKAVFNDGKE